MSLSRSENLPVKLSENLTKQVTPKYLLQVFWGQILYCLRGFQTDSGECASTTAAGSQWPANTDGMSSADELRLCYQGIGGEK